MPIVEPVALGGEKGYSLRHIGPKTSVWPTPQASVPTFVVLNQAAMIARPLPMDFQGGTYNLRLNDAGDGQVIFPNAEAVDGSSYRDRFDETGHSEFIEIYKERELDQTFCIVQVNRQMPTVTVSGGDPVWLLKKAFERDWMVLQAPRDVCERATQEWASVLVDNFDYLGTSTPAAQWTDLSSGTGTCTIGTSGRLNLKTTTGASSASLRSNAITVTATNTWRVQAQVPRFLQSGTDRFINMVIVESTNDTYNLTFGNGGANIFTSGVPGTGNTSGAKIPSGPSSTLMLESDGEFVFGYVNGVMVGCLHRYSASTTSLQVQLDSVTNAPGTTVLVDAIIVRAQQPFLMPGTDNGDYVLPGDITTYPWGGLHARYFNNADLLNDNNRLLTINSPPRTTAYGSTGTWQYADVQDANINAQANASGAAGSMWSCVWFGAIYLKFSAGDYPFSFTMPTGFGNNQSIRVFIGKTTFGDNLATNANAWPLSNTYTNTNGQVFTFTLTAASLAGTLSYGGGTVIRDGWYPIKVEYSVDANTAVAPIMKFTPPASYTDPGGTALTNASTIVPTTSLSPLGMIDQRYQGISHFDLVQQTLNAVDYQASFEPQRLESGLFPGTFAPRLREGHDTDVIVRPDVDPRAGSDSLLNYGNLQDASDFASTMMGNGAGLQSGTVGQLQSEVWDGTAMATALFDSQQWQDFSDSSFASLLTALLASELALRNTSWQNVSGDPLARVRLAKGWPLPAALSKMNWRVGDGIRIRARDVAVWDINPRQLLAVQRNFAQDGVTGTSVTWANRPRTEHHTTKRQLFTVSRRGRNYQRQIVTLSGSLQSSTITANSRDAGASTVILAAGDIIRRATVHVAVNLTTPGGLFNAVDFGLYINGAQFFGTSGDWQLCPLVIDVSSVSVVDSTFFARVQAQLFNNSLATSIVVQYQLHIEVVR